MTAHDAPASTPQWTTAAASGGADTDHVCADLFDLAVELLRRCAVEIVDDTQATLPNGCTLRREGGRLVPLVCTTSPTTRDLVVPQLALLRQIGTLPGPLSTAPFLRQLLDATAQLGN